MADPAARDGDEGVPWSAHLHVVLDKPFPCDAARALRASAVPGADPCSRAATDGSWRTARTPEGPVTARVSETTTTVEADVWGPGAPWLAARLPAVVGLLDDRAGFEPRHHPVVAEAARRRPARRLGASGCLFDALVPTVLGQRVTALEAGRSYRTLVRAFGGSAPGPADLPLPPDPVRLARLAPFQLHRAGVDGRRAATLIGLARRAAALDRLAATEVTHAAAVLSTLPGIGPWTLTTVRGLVWGDPDAAVLGDYHLPHTVAWVLAGEPRATDERMIELLAPFAGHRGRVQSLVASLRRAPRRGPRQRILPLAQM